MKESVTYQAILKEGRIEGLKIAKQEERIIARRESLIIVLEERFPAFPAEMRIRIERSEDADQLMTAIRQAARVARLEDVDI